MKSYIKIYKFCPVCNKEIEPKTGLCTMQCVYDGNISRPVILKKYKVEETFLEEKIEHTKV
jgi:hypothetical protein